MAIAAARAEIASTTSFAFLSSVRTDSGALAPSPGVAIPTSHQGVSETLAPYAGRPALTTTPLGLLFSDDGATFPEEASDPPAEKTPAPPEGVIDRLFGGDGTPLSDEAIDHLFGGDMAPLVGEASEPGSAGLSAAAALVGVAYFLGYRRRDREGKSRLQWLRA
jgi:MYXO-CTERM domain-containing protein